MNAAFTVHLPCILFRLDTGNTEVEGEQRFTSGGPHRLVKKKGETGSSTTELPLAGWGGGVRRGSEWAGPCGRGWRPPPSLLCGISSIGGGSL